MNKKFFIAWIVLFIAWYCGSFVVHGLLLGSDYMGLTFMRKEAEFKDYVHWMIIAHALMAGAFVWIYSKGVEAVDWFPQGLRYGFAVACLTVIPTYLIYYVVQPMPGMLVTKQIVFDGILMLVLGVIVAFLYRGTTRAA